MIGNHKKLYIRLCLGYLIMAIGTVLPAQSGDLSDQPVLNLRSESTQPSIGPDNLYRVKTDQLPLFKQSISDAGPPANQIAANAASFDGFNFNDNATETSGFIFIPPDPIGAAGLDRLIAVVNVMIESRDKAGTLLWRDALKDFFAPLSPTTFTFDPKVIYDHYEDRFVVVTLERENAGSNPDPGNHSRILLAVSKTAAPATASSTDWYYHAIDAEESILSHDYWVDYPGFEMDEEVVYITGNLFPHSGYVTVTSHTRLWIIDKGISGGFYDGGSAVVTRHDPYSTTGIATTTMPALVYGASGAGPGIGTYLVSHSGLSDGTNEYVQVVRVDDPLGIVSFSQQFVNLGNIDALSGNLPDAPQNGTTSLIEVNDRRALDAVWRDNRLWLTTTINPISGADAGQTTAYWIRLNTSNPGSLSVDDQGTIGGQDIDPGSEVYTFFPSLAVNDAGHAYFGFAASGANFYPGAYCAGRKDADPPGTVRSSETVRAGTDFYQRTFGTYPTDRNRWGDYSGTALDPADDNLFWIFNEYAMTRSGTAPEDGCWSTAWAAVSFVQTVFTNGADASLNFIQSTPSPPESDWPFAQFSLNGSNSGAFLNSVTIALSGSYYGLAGSQPFRLFAANTNNFSSALAIGSNTAAASGSVTFSSLADALPAGNRFYWVTVDLAADAGGTINSTISNSSDIDLSGASLSTSSVYGGLNSGFDVSLPVQLFSFSAEAESGTIFLHWTTQSETANLGFIIRRSTDTTVSFTDLASYTGNENLRGQGNTAETSVYQFCDVSVESGCTYYYTLTDVDFNGRQATHGPVSATAPALEITAPLQLNQNYPNPFNPTTVISFELNKSYYVDLSIYNLVGQKVATLVSSKKPGGRYRVEWDASVVPSGIYLYRVTTDQGFSETRKLIVLK